MINVTAKAIKELKKAQEHYKDKMNDQFVRVQVGGG